MRLKVLKQFTSNKGRIFDPGSIMDIAGDKAIPLLMAGKITPIDNCAYRIESSVLGCTLWVCHDEQARESLVGQGVTEVIYTRAELKLLKGLTPEELKAVYRVKEVFSERVTREGKGGKGDPFNYSCSHALAKSEKTREQESGGVTVPEDEVYVAEDDEACGWCSRDGDVCNDAQSTCRAVPYNQPYHRTHRCEHFPWLVPDRS